MQHEIQSCPLCGPQPEKNRGPQLHMDWGDRHLRVQEVAYVRCPACQMLGPAVVCYPGQQADAQAQAVEQWNLLLRRTTEIPRPDLGPHHFQRIPPEGVAPEFWTIAARYADSLHVKLPGRIVDQIRDELAHLIQDVVDVYGMHRVACEDGEIEAALEASERLLGLCLFGTHPESFTTGVAAEGVDEGRQQAQQVIKAAELALAAVGYHPVPEENQKVWRGGYSPTELLCKGCFGPCGRCEEVAATRIDNDPDPQEALG